MSYNITKAAVIGAGVMGGGIAAHLANVGIPSLLLDIVPRDLQPEGKAADRNRLAHQGLQRQLDAKPAAFYTKKAAALISIGNTEDDWERLREVDWIIEVVPEVLSIKRDTFARIEPVRRPDAIVSSNTSGIPASQLTEGRSPEFRRHFLITHFFNPARYMKLLELVPDTQTDPELLRFMERFGAEVLGKGTVICKDTPNFIGNRIGTYGFLETVRRMLDEGYRIEEVDATQGQVLGRPRSAVFRTADLAGVDTLVHVADNLYENLPNDERREVFKVPDFIREMVKRGWVGDKAGQGFYKRTKDSEGKTQILALDPATMEYRPPAPVHFTSLDNAKNIEDLGERIRSVVQSQDRAGTFAWETLADGLVYAARRVPEIADSIVAVDRAMRWGYNWELGPFETWDTLGVAATAQRLEQEGRAVPELVRRVLAAGGSFYQTSAPVSGETAEGKAARRQYFDVATGDYRDIPGISDLISITDLKKANKVVKRSKGASLVDLGDGVLAIELHSKPLNTIDDDVVAMLKAGVAEAERNFRALIVTTEAPDFSAGANLAQLLMGARMRQWPLIERVMRGFQDANMGLKYANVPVVIAPSGRALGGGCEIIMHGHHVRAHAETYIGLVEVGAGVIPAGGGCKELLARWQKSSERGPFAQSRHAFEIIGVATVSTSAAEAQDYRFLRRSDRITIDRDRLLRDAKADALALADARARGEWRKPEPVTYRLPGPGGRLVFEQQLEGLRLTGKITDHDAVVAGKLAWVLTGGETAPTRDLTEQDILDLEREAFLSLCGMPKSLERMQHLLTTGKPLRN
jgi:3-hydroxyacyl-CoA dehydrogenase